jgi:SAM-dependent methyltransferase
MPTPGNRAQLARVYSDETWRVYELLDESLAPSGPDSLYDVAGSYLTAESKLLDAGCRDAAHLIQLIQRYGVTGVGVDPVEVHIERARAAIAAAGVAERADVFVGVIQDLPYPDGHFDFVWCRDVVEQVDELDSGLLELFRVLKPGGHMLVYTTFATDRLTIEDAELLNRHLGNIPANLVEENVEAAFERAGFVTERKDPIGTEWREYLEEERGTVSRALIRLSRLRRQRATLAPRFGQDIYDSVEAILHWEVFQFLGKLLPTVYVLRRDGYRDSNLVNLVRLRRIRFTQLAVDAIENAGIVPPTVSDNERNVAADQVELVALS